MSNERGPTDERRALSVDEGAQRIAELFADSEDTREEDPQPDSAVDVEAADEYPEADLDSVEDETDEGEPEESEPADWLENVVALVVDGELKEMTVSQMRVEVQKHQAADKRMREAAELRRTTQVERDAVVQEREQYAAVLPQLEAVLSQAVGAEPNPAQFTDRAEYLFAKDQWNTAQSQLQAVQLERQRVGQLTDKERQDQLRSYLTEQQTLLTTKLPEWADAKVAQREQGEIAEYLKGQGYDDDEIGQLYDHRAVLIARKAALYDKMTAKGRAKAKQSKAKTAAPGSGSSPALSGKQMRDLREKAIQSGSVEDFGELFGKMLTGT